MLYLSIDINDQNTAFEHLAVDPTARRSRAYSKLRGIKVITWLESIIIMRTTLISILTFLGVATAQFCPEASRFGSTNVLPATGTLLKSGDVREPLYQRIQL
jgi:hypothetical protein